MAPDPAYHFVADPDPAWHFDADPDPTFQIGSYRTPYTLACRLQIDVDPDPDPAYHFDADPPGSTTLRTGAFNADQLYFGNLGNNIQLGSLFALMVASNVLLSG